MSCTDVLSNPCLANSLVATLSSRSFTGRTACPLTLPADSLDLNAMPHTPGHYRRRASYRQIGLKVGTPTAPGQLKLIAARGPWLSQGLVASELIEVDSYILHQVSGPVPTRPAAALLPGPRTGERSVRQPCGVQPAQMCAHSVLQRRPAGLSVGPRSWPAGPCHFGQRARTREHHVLQRPVVPDVLCPDLKLRADQIAARLIAPLGGNGRECGYILDPDRSADGDWLGLTTFLVVIEVGGQHWHGHDIMTGLCRLTRDIHPSPRHHDCVVTQLPRSCLGAHEPLVPHHGSRAKVVRQHVG